MKITFLFALAISTAALSLEAAIPSQSLKQQLQNFTAELHTVETSALEKMSHKKLNQLESYLQSKIQQTEEQLERAQARLEQNKRVDGRYKLSKKIASAEEKIACYRETLSAVRAAQTKAEALRAEQQ
jgi:predicted  nucleic acid-binding Zn-ribbon protein